MKYLLLGYHHESKWDALTPAEREAIGPECESRDDDLRRSGHLVAMGGLGHTRTTTSLRTRNGKLVVTDGPYVETKEQLGGFVIIEAKDLNEAIQIASRHPAASLNEHLGWGVELRPIEHFEEA